MRDYGRSTSVKNQESFGTCWDFASTASMESNILTQGLNNETADTLNLSEAGNTWYLHTNTTDTSSPVYNEYVEDPDKGAAGGNSLLAADSISSGYGTYPEELINYNSFYDSFSMGYPESYRFYSDYRLKDYTELDPTNIDLVKQRIMDVGASYYTYNNLSSNFHRTEDGIDTYYDSSKDDAPATSGHAVTIIGWDDNFSKENFNPDNQPEHDGAWLVKNSWGEDINITGQPIEANEKYNGYFWVSYDSKVYDITQFEMQKSDNLENIYQHQVSALDYINVDSAANVFTADSNEKLEQICFGNTGEADVNVSIYRLDDNFTSPVDGTLLSSFDTTIDYTGTHTVDCPDDIILTKGDKFSVIITNKAKDGKELFLKYKPEDYNSREVAGKSYFTFEDSDWTDIANENEDISYMAIKAYTSNVTVDKTKLANLLEEVKDFTPDTNIPQSEIDKYYESLDLAKNLLANEENPSQIAINNAYYSLKGKYETFGGYCLYINSMEDFIKFHDELCNNNKSYKYIQLNTDLDFSGYEFDEPIFGRDNVFTGVFNGNGHTIKNYTCKTNGGLDYNSAFFTYTDGAVIKNITFDNADISGESHAGVITSESYNTQFINCTVKNSTVQTYRRACVAIISAVSTECSFIDCTIDNCSAIGGTQACLVSLDRCSYDESLKNKIENLSASNYTIKALYQVNDNMGSELAYYFSSDYLFPILTITDDKCIVEEFVGKIKSVDINGKQYTPADGSLIMDKTTCTAKVDVNFEEYEHINDFIISFDLAKKGIIILNYQGANTDVTIPSELYSAPVVAIDDEFSCLDENFEEIYITSITIPGTVKSIPERLLSYSPCLESVVLEEGIEEIGNYAFSGCNLNSIDLPDSLRSIGDLAFFNNNIKSVVLGKNIEKIGDKALGYTYSLRKLDKIEDFVISGYAGTAAEEYAKANGFTFVDLSNSEQTDNTTNETAQLMPCA